MKKILVLCDRIPPDHSATGAIEYHIAGKLSKHAEVHLVCLTDTGEERREGNLYIHPCQSRYGRYQSLVKKAQASRGLAKLVGKIRYHLYYRLSARKGLGEVKDHRRALEKACRNVIEREQPLYFLSTSNPFVNQEIAATLVKAYPQLKWFPHLMDSNRNNAVYKAGREQELEVLASAKAILAVPALRNDIDFCKDFEERLHIIHLPIIPTKAPMPARRADKETVDYVYTGLFYSEIRNPETLLKLFLSLPDNHILHLYSRGCNEVLDAYRDQLGNRLQIHGFVDTQTLEKATADADVLVNLGNTVANQAPSKIYNYIAAGKPVLNFYQTDEDPSLPHAAQYPRALSVLYENAPAEAAQIAAWANAQPAEPLSYEEATAGLQALRLSSVSEAVWDILQTP